MTKGIGIITAINGVMMSFAGSSLDGVDAMGQLARETGVSVEYMQKFGYIASVNGGSVDSLQNSVRGLSERIGEYASQDSGEGKAIFEKLGIAVRNANGDVKNAAEVMEELRGKFSGFSKVEQISMANKLGIDSGMLQTLNLTNEAVKETSKGIEDLLFTKEDTEKTMAYNDAITTSKTLMTAIGRQVSLGLLPNMMNLVTSFNDFVFANSKLIKGGLDKTVYWFQSVMSAITNTGKAIYEGIDYFIGIENALMIAGAAALYFGRSLMMNPIGLIVGGVVLLIAIIDDLYVAFNGGESVIDNFFKSFDIDIVNVLTNAFDGLKMTFNSLLGLMLRVSESFTSLVLLGAKAGNFFGMDIDTKGIESFKKMQENTRLKLSQENLALGRGIANRSMTINQTNTINQEIKGNDARQVANLTENNTKNAMNSAIAQIPNNGG